MGKREDLIYHDDLTGIYNKRFFHKINEIIKKEQISFIIFDIDDFKYINDVYGHYAGDMVIKEIGIILLKYLPDSAFPIRYGGDEFIIIWKNTNKEKISSLISILKKTITSQIIQYDSQSISITCSFGIAIGYAEEMEKLIKKADYALYSSKENGKNQFTFYDENIKKINYIPFPIMRKISLNIVNKKMILIKGTFKSGKSFIINNLKNKYKDYRFVHYDIEEINDDNNGNLCIFYNPAIIINNKEKIKKLYVLRKKFDYIEYTIKNFKKIDLQTLYKINNYKYSLLKINYLDLISSGNIGIINNYFLHGDHLSYKLYNYEEMEGIETFLSKKQIEIFKTIVPMGLRFNIYDIKKYGINADALAYLTDILLIEKREDEYLYTYPALYFFLKDKYSIKSLDFKYNIIFDLINKISIINTLNRKEKMKLAERVFNYGDVYLANKIISTINEKGDNYYNIKCKILLEKNEYKLFEEHLDNIKNTTIKNKLNAFYIYKSGKENIENNTNDTDIAILNLLMKISKKFNKRLINQINKIKGKRITIRQKILLFVAEGNYYSRIRKFDLAIKSLKNAQTICLKEHYIADYAKTLMNVGLIYNDMKKFNLAIKSLNRALLIFQISNNNNALISCNFNLALVYADWGDYDKAIGIYSSLLTLYEISENYFYRAHILHNLAESYLRMFHIDDAEKSIMNAISIYNKLNMNSPIYMNILKNMILLLKYNEVEHIEITEDMDIIDKYDVELLKLLNNKNSDKIIDYINLLDTNDEIDKIYKTELIIFTSQYFKKNIELKKILLQMALKKLENGKRIIRKKYVMKLMEE